MQKNNIENFEGIQYLRAIAAVMVVVHHARYFFENISGWSGIGAAGVDIFFVISGFIMVHATRNFDANQFRVPQAIDFLAKRAIRVIPLYWIALLYQNKRSLIEGEPEAGLISDFLFIPRYSTWAPDQIWPSLVPGWTINYEIFFYFLFGIALFFGAIRYLFLASSMVALITIGQLYHFQNPALIFWTSIIIGEFLLGMLVYWVIKKQEKPAALYLVLFIAAAGILGLIYGLPQIARTITNGPFAAMIVWSGVHLGRLLKEQNWLLVVGNASYSIYLSHQFTFAFSGRLLHAFNLNRPTAMNIALVLFIETAVAVLIGIILHRILERPLLSALNTIWLKIKKRSKLKTQTA